METVTDFIIVCSKITVDGDCSHEIQRCFLLRRKAMTNLESILKRRDITLPTKVSLSQSYGFCSGHVWMWELDYKESWALKNWCFWTVVLEKTLESPLDCKEIKPISPKGNHLWILEGLILKLKLNTLATWCEELTHWKRPWCWERLKVGGEGMTEDEIVGWHHWLSGHEFVQTPGDSEGQGSLACCSPWGHKKSDMTEQLYNNEYNHLTLSNAK